MSVKPGHTMTSEIREETEALIRTMPGSLGQLTIDIGDDKFIRIALWTSAEDRSANVGTPADQRQREMYGAHLDQPIIGQGEVVSNTLQLV